MKHGQKYKHSNQIHIGRCIRDKIGSVATNEDVFFVLPVSHAGAELSSSDLC